MSPSKMDTQTFEVTLVNPASGLNVTVPVKSDEYIYDVAADKGIKIPASCCTGACIACAAQLVSGEIEQDHTFLSKKEVKAGFLLTCRTYPRSNCVIKTHQEDALFAL